MQFLFFFFNLTYISEPREPTPERRHVWARRSQTTWLRLVRIHVSSVTYRISESSHLTLSLRAGSEMDACDSGLTPSRWLEFGGESIYRPVKYEPGVVKKPSKAGPLSGVMSSILGIHKQDVHGRVDWEKQNLHEERREDILIWSREIGIRKCGFRVKISVRRSKCLKCKISIRTCNISAGVGAFIHMAVNNMTSLSTGGPRS